MIKLRNKIKKGKAHHSYVDGFYLIPHFCVDCGIQLKSHRRGVQRCLKCTGKLRQKHYFCIDCKKEVSSNTVKRCQECWGKTKRGNRNYFYKDGSSMKEYNGEFTEKLKQQIKIRDKFQCQACGLDSKETSILFHVHHIDENKHNNHSKNLILLCHNCHSEIHGLIKMKKTSLKEN
jgi:DNA-directed RNA polymerase subunit RPC12/RpoP